MRVVCILFCSFCDHDMATCSVARVSLGLETQSLCLDKKVLFTSLTFRLKVTAHDGDACHRTLSAIPNTKFEGLRKILFERYC